MRILAKLLSAAACAGALALMTPLRAETLRDYVLQAFAAEENASRKSALLIYRRGETVTHYDIERVLPDRLHMRIHSSTVQQEFFVIGERMYYQDQGTWQVSPVAGRPGAAPSLIELFKNRLGKVEEHPSIVRNGLQQRVFSTTISWTAGRARNEGRINMHIDTTANLPRLISFSGQCDGQPCAFEQTMTYDTRLSIEPPVQ